MSYLVILFLIVHHYVQAETCDKYKAYSDFKNRPPVVTNYTRNDQLLLSVRDQNSIGYCYAYAAADMLEVWLKSKGELAHNQHISAAAMGLNYYKNQWKHETDKIRSQIVREQSLLSNFFALRDEINGLEEKIYRTNEELVRKQGRWVGLSRGAAENKELGRLREKSISLHGLKMAKESEMRKIKIDFNNSYGVPMGGFAEVAIEKAWPTMSELRRSAIGLCQEVGIDTSICNYFKKKYPINLCLESEVSSSDNALRGLMGTEAFQNNIFMLDNFQSAQGYLASGTLLGNNEKCSLFLVGKSLFPGMPFNNPDNFFAFISTLNGNIFENLLKKSCGSIKPEASRGSIKTIGRSFLSGTDGMFELVDDALENGQIASVSYHPDILISHNTQKKSRHASVIVGSLKLCGEPYYILRNSLGPKSCSIDIDFFNPGTKELRDKNTVLRKIRDECTKKAHDLTDKIICLGLGSKKSHQCYENKQRRLSFKVRECDRSYQNKRFKELLLPYFCDSKGNYIISKKQLEKGVYRASTMSH